MIAGGFLRYSDEGSAESDNTEMEWEPYDRHWIRLRGPWEVVGIEETAPQTAVRTTLPADWRTLFGDRSGTARFIRRFQRPTGLDADERVCVTLVDARADVRCRVNGTLVPQQESPLGDPECWPEGQCLSFDLTDHLQASNELILEVTVDDPHAGPAGLHQPVLLEIVTLDDE